MDKIEAILKINNYIKDIIWNIANQENNNRIHLSLRQTEPQIVQSYSYVSTIELIGKSKYKDIEIEDSLIFEIHYTARKHYFYIATYGKRKSMDIVPSENIYYSKIESCKIGNEDVILYPMSLDNYIRKMVRDFINYIHEKVKIALQSKEKIEERFKSLLDKAGQQQYKLRAILNKVVKIGRDFHYVFGIAYFILTNYNIKVEFDYLVETDRLNISTIVLDSFRKIGLEESLLEQLILADVLAKVFDF